MAQAECEKITDATKKAACAKEVENLQKEVTNLKANVENKTPPSDKGKCEGLCWIINIIANVITFLIWVVVQILKFVLGIMGAMFTIFVTVNPADNKLLNVAYTPWQAVVNISNIVLISGIVFMGFGYILNLSIIKQSKGLQDFFLGILIVGAMMNFTFAASAGVVNLANGIGNIIYFGAGGLASQNAVAPSNDGISTKVAQRIDQCRENNKGNPGGGFVITFICNVSSVSDITSLAESGDMGGAFAKMFGDPAVKNIVIISIVALIYVFSIIAFAKVLFVLIVRIFGVWMLIVVSPLALVSWFSPLPMIKDFGKQWLDYFTKLAFAYPFFTFGITLVTLVIGKIGSALRVSTGQTSMIDGSISTYAQQNAAERFFDEDLISGIIIALFSFGLVYLFGELFWKVFAVFWNAAKSVGGAVWNKGGKQILGGARGLANAGIRKAAGGAKVDFATDRLNTAQGGLSKLQSELAGIKDKTSQPYKDKEAQVKAQQRKVKAAQASLQRAKQFKENFTMQGWVASKKEGLKDFAGRWGLDGEMEKKRSQFYVDNKKMQRYSRYARSEGGRKYLALKGDQTFGKIKREDYDSQKEFLAALEEEAGAQTAKNKLRYDQPATNGDTNRKRVLGAKDDAVKDLIGQYTDANGKKVESFDKLNDAQKQDLLGKLNSDQKEQMLKYLDDSINGPGGLGELRNDLFVQSFLQQKENFAKLSKEAKEKFYGDDDSFGQLVELLPEDELNKQLDLKGSSKKALDSLSRGSRSSSRLVKTFDEKFSSGYLQKQLGPDGIPDNGAGVAITSGVVAGAKSRLGDIGKKYNLDDTLNARARTDIESKSKKIGDSFANMVKSRIETASPADLELGKDGRTTLTKTAMESLKKDVSTQMFGSDINNQGDLNNFLSNTELGAELAQDESFKKLSANDQVNYASALREAMKSSYDGAENDHLLMDNISSTAQVFGADKSINAQIDPAAAAFSEGIDDFEKLWKTRTGVSKDQDQGNNRAAKHFVEKGNEDQAMEILAMKEMADSMLADPNLTADVKNKINEYIKISKELQATTDPKKVGDLAKKMSESIEMIKFADPATQTNIQTKTAAIKNQVQTSAQKTTAHIEAKKIQEKIATREGLKLEIQGQPPITVNKQSIAKVATPEELFADMNEFMVSGDFSKIENRLKKQGVATSEIAGYHNIFKAVQGGKVDGRDANSRVEKAKQQMFESVSNAGSHEGIGKQLGDRKKAALDHATNAVDGFHKKNQTAQSAKELLGY